MPATVSGCSSLGANELRILVTGREGQVTRALQALGRDRPEVTVIACGRPEFDLLDERRITGTIEAARPDVIVNAAAYTAVDKAEADERTATLVNGVGAGSVARAAHARGVPIIHISTDYVFDGTKPEPYLEHDAVGPVSAYGRTKLTGELLVAAANPKHIILRTSWVYAETGANFAKTMLRLAKERGSVRVVADQFGTPTYAGDIARAIVQIANGIVQADGSVFGIYHLTNDGHTTWADFAEEIFAASVAHGGPPCSVTRITTAEYPTPARRPANSRLNTDKVRTVLGVTMPHWRDATRACVAALYSTGA
jgi:dTDP-4-dehydrorhamnose reductase